MGTIRSVSNVCIISISEREEKKCDTGINIWGWLQENVPKLADDTSYASKLTESRLDKPKEAQVRGYIAWKLETRKSAVSMQWSTNHAFWGAPAQTAGCSLHSVWAVPPGTVSHRCLQSLPDVSAGKIGPRWEILIYIEASFLPNRYFTLRNFSG